MLVLLPDFIKPSTSVILGEKKWKVKKSSYRSRFRKEKYRGCLNQFGKLTRT
ncbi:hypothetical protein LEP1GSC106_2814 [Leptospira interrogans serovar Grippotyphosa str. UI 12764]|nr:hypothetical protein LEP1GSC106_2814 [Leptospira interrogans serovar Grippotyphosa str. UI 12764]